MIPASDLFARALRHSHTALTRVILHAPVTGGGFTDAGTLSVTAGSLRIDGTRAVWRSTSGMVLAPTDATTRALLLDIDSTCRLTVERGIRFSDGTEEWMQIAHLQVRRAQSDQDGASLRVDASDLGCLLEDYPLVTPYATSSLTTVAAIQDLVGIADVWAPSPWVIDPALSLTTTPAAGTVFTGSRADAVTALADSLAAVCHYGADGAWHLRPAAVDTAAPVASYPAGPGGVLLGYDRSRSRDDEHNAVILPWDGPSAGGTVFVVDNDPTSPTYWDGPFGRRPIQESSNAAIKTEAQAIAAATAKLDGYRGRAATVEFDAVHDPRLEPMDPVVLTARDLGERTLIVDAIGTYPLAGGRMSASTRLVREVTP